MRRLTFTLIALIVCAGCADEPPATRINLATTTSVANSGLLDTLLPAFTAETAIDVRPMLVGSGRALQLLVSGDADAAITHAPAAEARTLNGRDGWLYRKIMFNDFVIVGPRADHAGAAKTRSVVDAMRRIASSGVVFVSRGDSSGTHERERELWTFAGREPERGRLVVAGSGMGSTLRIAGNVGGYTLTDRATFAQHAPRLPLTVLFEGGEELINTYAVVVRDGSAMKPARQFAMWLSDGNGRRIIHGFKVGTQQLQVFFPWPADAPGDRPHSLPHSARP